LAAVKACGATSGKADDRVEAFLAEVLALEGEEPDAIRPGVCVALGDTETKFRVREDN
jgi:hypothetical protein